MLSPRDSRSRLKGNPGLASQFVLLNAPWSPWGTDEEGPIPDETRKRVRGRCVNGIQ
jgi:hypothetical protein